MVHQGPAAPHGDVGSQLLAQAGLADAGLPHHHQQGALARQSAVEGPLQLLQLRLPPHEDPPVHGVGAGSLTCFIGCGCSCGLVQRLQGLEHFGSGGGTFRGVFLQQPQDQRLQGWRHRLVVPGGGHRRRVQVLGDDGHTLVPHEGRPACNKLVEHGPQGVEVRLGGHLLAQRLLRGHVGHGARHHPLLGEAGLGQGQGQAEVADLGRAIAG